MRNILKYFYFYLNLYHILFYDKKNEKKNYLNYYLCNDISVLKQLPFEISIHFRFVTERLCFVTEFMTGLE